MNALKHGLLAKTVILPDENPEEYTTLCDDVVQDLKPLNVIEERLVDQICHIFWRLRRAGRADREVSIAHICYERIRIEKAQRQGSILDQIGIVPESEDERKRREELLVEADQGASMSGRMMMSGIEQLEGLSRYESGLERRLFRLLAELRQLQGGRVEEAV